MTEEFRVRRLRPEDDVQLEALYARTRNPYREEDAGAVEAMHRLALLARETGCRWSALPPEARNVSDAEHRAFWVAVPLANEMLEIIGTVGLRIVGDNRSDNRAAAGACANSSGGGSVSGRRAWASVIPPSRSAFRTASCGWTLHQLRHSALTPPRTSQRRASAADSQVP